MGHWATSMTALHRGLVVAAVGMGMACTSATLAQPLALEPVATGLNQPMFVTAPANDTRLFYVERGGIIKVQQAPGATPTPFLNISAKVATDGERGLLGMAFDPNYAANGRFYVNYIDSTTLNTVVERYTVSANANVANTTAQNIITVNQPPGRNNHKAGWIGFRPGEGGNLYIATGDGGGGTIRTTSRRTSTPTSARSSAWTSAAAARALPRRATHSLAATAATPSGHTACATLSATALTATPQTSTSPTSARARARK